jgi:hypothetical protein
MENKNSIIYKRSRRSIVIKYCMIACLLVQGINVKSQVGMLTVISNQNGAPGSMKLSELKSVMKGEKQRWNNGPKVTVAIMKTNTPAGEKTAQVIYNMSGNALLKFFLGQSYQGISYTTLFNTITELENYVAQNPGAIGIIDQPLTNNEIKIITIDGKTQFNFNMTSELEIYTAQNPGAIGVIDQPLTNNEIKIITIDGKTQFNFNTTSEPEIYIAQNNPGTIGVIDQPLTNNEIKTITINGKTQFNL